MSKYSDVKKIILNKWPNAKIISIKEFPEGYNNLPYDVKLGHGEYVIKILKVKGCEDYILKQKHIRALTHRKFKDFPISKIVKADFSGKVINKPYAIVEKLEGKSLQTLYKKVNNKEELYEEIGELYGKLHSFKFDKFSELDSSLKPVKEYKSWYLGRSKRVKKLFKKIEERKLLSEKRLKVHKIFFEKNKYLLRKDIIPCLCHGDASHTNIIIKKVGNKYKVSGMIDFEFARISEAAYDLFAGIRTFEKKYEYRESLVKGYTKWNKLPKQWEKLIFLYLWIGHLNQLTKIKSMKWRNLSEEDTLNRKKSLRKKSILVLKKIEKELSY